MTDCKDCKTSSTSTELQIVFIQQSERIFTFRKQTCTRSQAPDVQSGIPKGIARSPSLIPTELWQTSSRKEVEPPNPCRPQQTPASWFHWKFWYHVQFFLESRRRFLCQKPVLFTVLNSVFISENCCELSLSCAAVRGKYIYLPFLGNLCINLCLGYFHVL